MNALAKIHLPHKKPKSPKSRMLIGFPPEMLETIRQRADDNVRSVNGEVVHLIKFALSKIEEQFKP